MAPRRAHVANAFCEMASLPRVSGSAFSVRRVRLSRNICCLLGGSSRPRCSPQQSAAVAVGNAFCLLLSMHAAAWHASWLASSGRCIYHSPVASHLCHLLLRIGMTLQSAAASHERVRARRAQLTSSHVCDRRSVMLCEFDARTTLTHFGTVRQLHTIAPASSRHGEHRRCCCCSCSILEHQSEHQLAHTDSRGAQERSHAAYVHP